MKKYRFQRRIIVRSVAIVAGMMIILAVLAASYYISTNRNDQAKQMNFLTENIAAQISTDAERLDEITLQLSTNVYIVDTYSRLQNLKGTENYFIQMLAQDAEIKRFMWSYILKRNSVYRICLFNEANDFTYVGTAIDYRFLQAGAIIPFAQQVKDDFSKVNREPLYTIYEFDPFFSEKHEKVFAVRRCIHDTSIVPARTVGYVEIQYLMKNFEFDYNFDMTDLQGFLLDRTGHVLLRYHGEDEMETLLSTLEPTELSKKQQITLSQGYTVRIEPLKEYGLVLAIVQNQSKYQAFIITTLFIVFIFTALIIAVMLAGQCLLVRHTTKPIVDLCDVLANLDPSQDFGEQPLLLPGESNELIQLNHAFGTMLKNLHCSMEKTAAAQKGELRSHMLALQSQMNPHFIHNVISVISAMADEQHFAQIPDICRSLSEMIRYSSDYDNSLVSVQMELQNAINYLELMKRRYEEGLTYSIEITGDDGEHLIPKFIFQPLVENCFKNGTKNKEFPWNVRLRLDATPTQWSFEVEDNGKGMNAEEINRLYARYEEVQMKIPREMMNELRIGGLSIYSILIRLTSLYGHNVIFEVQSPLTGGCRIKIGGMLYPNSSIGSGR